MYRAKASYELWYDINVDTYRLLKLNEPASEGVLLSGDVVRAFVQMVMDAKHPPEEIGFGS